MKPSEALAANLRAYRARVHHDQEQVAAGMRRLGHRWTRATVAEVEAADETRRKRRRVSVDELVALGAMIGIPPCDLLIPDPPIEPVDIGNTYRLKADEFRLWLHADVLAMASMDGSMRVQKRVRSADDLNLEEQP